MSSTNSQNPPLPQDAEDEDYLEEGLDYLEEETISLKFEFCQSSSTKCRKCMADKKEKEARMPKYAPRVGVMGKKTYAWWVIYFIRGIGLTGGDVFCLAS